VNAEQALRRLYTQAAKRLRLQIAAALANDAVATAAYRQQQLDAVERELANLRRRTRVLGISTVSAPYVASANAVDRALGIRGLAAFRFTGAHVRSVQVVADQLTRSLNDATVTVGRRTDDALRRIGLEEIGLGIAGGDARREVSRRITDRIVQEGVTDALTGVVDRRGARWQLDTYAEMVARTTTREAVSAGFHARMRETGEQLVTISSHFTSCEICAQYEGQTFALPDETVDGYDTIDTLPPFHPNCRHVATPAGGSAERFLSSLEADGYGVVARRRSTDRVK
jgi:hypothetical protein